MTSRQANEGKTEKQQGLWPERDAGRDHTEKPERHMQKLSNRKAVTHNQSPGQCEATESRELSRRLRGRDRQEQKGLSLEPGRTVRPPLSRTSITNGTDLIIFLLVEVVYAIARARGSSPKVPSGPRCASQPATCPGCCSSRMGCNGTGRSAMPQAQGPGTYRNGWEPRTLMQVSTHLAEGGIRARG